jgi:hypothetical protein
MSDVVSYMTKEAMNAIIAEVLEHYNNANPEGFDDHTVELDSMEDFIEQESFGDFVLLDDYPFIRCEDDDENSCSFVFKWKDDVYSLNYRWVIDENGTLVYRFTDASMCKVKLIEKTYKVYVPQEAGE